LCQPVGALTPQSVGTFDVVLFLGVLYHQPNPFWALRSISQLAREHLVVETLLDAETEPRPAMRFYPGSSKGDDDTNWWGPNAACVLAMLRLCGFTRIQQEYVADDWKRAVFHAFR